MAALPEIKTGTIDWAPKSAASRALPRNSAKNRKTFEMTLLAITKHLSELSVPATHDKAADDSSGNSLGLHIVWRADNEAALLLDAFGHRTAREHNCTHDSIDEGSDHEQHERN